MNTKHDIQDGEQLTITVRVESVDEWENHDHIAAKVACVDVEGNDLSLTLFHNNDAAEFDWDPDRWYKLKNATGNVYRGQKQLNPSYEFGIVPLDGPPDGTDMGAGPARSRRDIEAEGATGESVPTTADGGSALSQQRLTPGNYLLQFRMGELPQLEVRHYQIEVRGGLDRQELDGGLMGFTAKVAAFLRFRSGGPVTTNGPLQVYAVNELNDELTVDGYTVQTEFMQMETIEAKSFDGQGALQDLVKQDLKEALDGQYDVQAINSIIEHTPAQKAESGHFTASCEFACRIAVAADGTVICGVGVSLHFESTYSAAEYVSQGHDIEGVTVTHDTDVYSKDATGRVSRLLDRDYDAFDQQLGCSLAEWHLENERVEPDVVESLTAGKPVLAEIDYNGWAASQALDLCRVVPTLDELKQLDPDFHQRAQRESRMLPDERFMHVTSFIKSIGATPVLGLEAEPRPSNVAYDELNIDTSTNLRFGDGRTAPYGKAGLDRSGVHQAPDSLDLLFLHPERYERESKRFLEELLSKLRDYGADPTSLKQESYTLGREFDYTRYGGSADERGCVVAVVPDKAAVDDMDTVDDPYPEFKRQFGQRRVPSQMVAASSLDEPAYLGNIAAGVVAKAGGIPWRIDEVPGGGDVFVGLDVTYDPETGQHLGASANIVMADGTILASESVSLQQGETFEVDDVIDVLKDLIRVCVAEEGGPPSQVTIHRDGQFYLDVDDLVDRLEAASDFIPKFNLVEIRKSGNPRIAEYTGDDFEVASKGVGFVSRSGEHAYLATTGKPEISPNNSLGTPRPIQVVKRHGSTDIGTLTEQVYWLSEAHVASISRSTRLPITTEYADQCAEYAREGFMLNDELIRGVPYV